MPFWLYLYGCAATLVLTFGVLGYFAGVSEPGIQVRTWGAEPARRATFLGRWGARVLRAGSVSCLLLTIVAGFIGTDDPQRNGAIALFWVVFVLGFSYLTFLVGNLFELTNPWTIIIDGLERTGLRLSVSRVRYPDSLGYWPALVLYAGLIWIELFVLPKPFVLAAALAVYTVITIAGSAVFGAEVWLRRGELFSVYFGLISTLAPVEYTRLSDGGWNARLRPPFVGALRERPEHISLVLFVLFMLSSTTYDAIHQTVMWIGLFWSNALTLLQPLWGNDFAKAQDLLMDAYLVYQRGGLLLSPFLYLGLYLLVLWSARAVTRTTIPVRTLALSFCYSLIPIALAYHFTHYYTMILREGRSLLWIASDPFGIGWNLLRLLPPDPEPPPLQMATVWHTQVVAILVGHVVSVYLAHIVATRIFSTRRQVMLSQVPLLVLMVVYTAIGLWILSLPLAPG